MSYVIYDNFGIIEFYQNVSGKDERRDENFDKVKSAIRDLTGQLKELPSEINLIEQTFFDFGKRLLQMICKLLEKLAIPNVKKLARLTVRNANK